MAGLIAAYRPLIFILFSRHLRPTDNTHIQRWRHRHPNLCDLSRQNDRATFGADEAISDAAPISDTSKRVYHAGFRLRDGYFRPRSRLFPSLFLLSRRFSTREARRAVRAQTSSGRSSHCVVLVISRIRRGEARTNQVRGAARVCI